MKYIIVCACTAVIIFIFVFYGVNVNQGDKLKLMVYADSSFGEDMGINFEIRDIIKSEIKDLLGDLPNENKKEVLTHSSKLLERALDDALGLKKISCKSKVSFKEEGEDFFVVVCLGDCKGIVWECRLDVEDFSKNLSNPVYISKIWEIIQNVKGREK